MDATLELYPVATHVFHMFWSFLPEATDALKQCRRFIHHSAADSDPTQCSVQGCDLWFHRGAGACG